MAQLSFTPHLARHVATPSAQVKGASVREVLQTYFQANPQVQSYVLDDQGHLRKHLAVFLNRELLQDRSGLSDPVAEDDEIFVMQALSGG